MTRSEATSAILCADVELPECVASASVAQRACDTDKARLKDERDAWHEHSVKMRKLAAESPRSAWYESPVLWGVVGLAAGATVVILAR